MSALLHPPPRRMTVEEFFDWDGDGHVGKLELVNGMCAPSPMPVKDMARSMATWLA